MLTALLIIIYISFISLGLPDSLLGSAWPVMYLDLGTRLSFAGVISMIISCGTVISSLMSTRLIKRYGTGLVTAVSVAMTAVALFGFGLSGSALFLCIFAIPMGLGAGSVDSALNNFVAQHYEAKHMNWLHCFWGIGATSGPFIMAFWLTRSNNWNMGYITIGVIQSILVLALLFSLPLWKKMKEDAAEGEEKILTVPLKDIVKIPHAKAVLLSLFCYCGLELTTGLWGGSYAVEKYGILSETAAAWTSCYYLGITLGRLAAGFISMKLSNKIMIRSGQAMIGFGILILCLPLPVWKVPIAMCMIGIGCAPIYPGILHQTPQIFGTELSQAMMGIQMACAYVGSTFLPPLFGLLAQYVGIGLFPIYLLLFIAIMAACTELVNRRRKEAA